jgi:hypothetical protein
MWACENPQEERNMSQVAGVYNRNTGNITILVSINDPIYEIAVKHELCHRQQGIEGRICNCSNPMGMILNEMECYIMAFE